MSGSHPIRVGLYGSNGHQIQGLLVRHPRARLIGIAEFPREKLPEELRADASIREYPDLAALASSPEVDLVVLCSPRRCEQAAHAIHCLAQGKHVYAEKPAAFSEPELEAILQTARAHGVVFHEMAGSALEQPWLTLRQQVQAGKIGTVMQIFAQKSYPYHTQRPQDEDIDGGLLMQVGIHAVRFIEQIGGQRVTAVSALDTRTGNPVAGGNLRMACAANLRLENGGIATFIANYGNSTKFGTWGNEAVRVFGTAGFLEAINGGTATHLYLNNEDCGPLPITEPGFDFFDQVLDDICKTAPTVLSLEEELHPLRVVIRARAAANASLL